jgi:beta-glucuronidase
MGRVSSESEAKILLNWAKDLNCNYIRLAHYPHNEDMVKMAEKMGLMVWSEIPVYWDINWDNEHTYEVAENMLKTIIKRDKNRANVIIWSVANETPRKNSRTKFLYKLISKVRELDSQRLVSAALHEVDFDKNTNTKIINDDLANLVDILAINNYCGWYGGSDCQNLNWKSSYNKPMFMSEFGGGSLFGLHGSSDERWTEEFQDNIYREHFKMFEKIDFLSGVSPWILKDFKTPIRMLPGIQDQWNRKGLVSDRGQFKKAFFSLKNFYEKL